ncbi:beta-lactamase-like enzyme, transpeptidase superfamily [Psychroflexus torquis ATCC 700755]|uniref:Beta-lactamase-like enzyme, transpeptidase superfamily n=1 Tax=Psychroflexus torquis (strain ATCC 700755 / CIP 106069 / ACAM 623) TaxID=313595 RepID=K4IDY1_PSYTT|nr:serine hydrolase domain-containing protein [Psychroflexus torquis]AFU68048.1 beta-lactamase-like enzyme, transpeptidase superfamily [Psychroflexus torquis ATCC 700755]
MKFNSKLVTKLFVLGSILGMITYTMFQNFAFSNFETMPSDNSEVTDPIPKVPVVDYNSLFSPELNVFEDQIQKRAKRNSISGSVIVAYKDQILYEEDFGYKNPITKTPMEPNMSYQLASVSKQYTAAAILKLYQEKRLDIDQSVSTYLPGFKFEKVTIRDLLKHRSGLWNYMYLTEKYWEKDIAPNNLEVVDLINTNAPRLNFPAGRYFSYSNTGYVVLGAIVEQITQLNLGKFIEEEFLLPLCLDETFVDKHDRNEDVILDGYQSYRRSFIELPEGFHNNAMGDKGIYASAKDLFVWFRDLKNGKIVNKNSVDLMFGRNENGKNKSYGMGFRLEHKSGEEVIFHNGLWDGFRNGIEFHPKDDLVIIVMTHTQNKQKHYFQDYLVKKAKDFIHTAEQRTEVKDDEKELIL